MMKFPLALLANDIHVNANNIADFQLNWNEMLEVADKFMVDDIVIGGDLWQSRSSQSLSTLLAVKEALEKVVSEDHLLTVALGNHCKTDQEALVGYSNIFEGLSPNIDIVKDYQILDWEESDFVLVVMSYFPEKGSFLDRLEKAIQDAIESYHKKVKSKSDIILYIHEGIHGALGDLDIPNELPQEPFLDFKKVLVGHLHNRCKIKNTPIEYIGASRTHSFGEDNEKGYTLLYSDGSTKFIQNQVNTRYKTIELTPEQLEDFKLDKDPLYKYRLKVICDERDSKLFDRQPFLEMGFDKVEIKELKPLDKETIATAITERYDKKGIQDEYRNFCKENVIDSRLGIKYLG